MLPELSSVKSRRQKLGIKQKELANACKVSQSLIAKLESGKAVPAYSIMQRIFSFLDSQEHIKEKKCSDLMSKSVIFISSKEKISRAVEIMKKHSISQLPVVENKNSIGSISESLIFNKLAEGISQKKLSEMKISEIMNPAFPVIESSFPISLATPLLKQSEAILLIEGKKISGIITKADVI
jgi:predicted transcriptional regulator